MRKLEEKLDGFSLLMVVGKMMAPLLDYFRNVSFKTCDGQWLREADGIMGEIEKMLSVAYLPACVPVRDYQEGLYCS